eukprot:8666471-Ditylum_brightwellii.AAC.1
MNTGWEDGAGYVSASPTRENGRGKYNIYATKDAIENVRKRECRTQKAVVCRSKTTNRKWKQDGEVIVMADANSPLRDKEFGSFLADTGLYDLIGIQH